MVTLFAISMGYFESAIVVYIRQLIYPEGFAFPLKAMNYTLARTELFREAFSLLMIISVAILAAREAVKRFAAFLYIFAVWDIFYYVFLKLLLDWPASLLTPDVLFLLPVVWVGPVLAPVINSLTMIILAWVILLARANRLPRVLGWAEWGLLVLGSVIVLVAYTQDYVSYLSGHIDGGLLETYYSQDIFELSSAYMPDAFAWLIFSVGVAMHLAAIGNVIRRIFRDKRRIQKMGGPG